MPTSCLRIASCVTATLLMNAAAGAQPAPSFLATCQDLREKVAQLKRDEDELTTIEVEGEATFVRQDAALAYILVCAPPNPRVLCVTYQTNGIERGERVIVTGSLIPRDADHIQLDPCLGRRAD